MNFREFSSKRNLLLFVSTAAILGLPLILAFLFGQDRTRAQMTIITNDIDLQRYVLVKAKMGWDQLNIFGSDFFLTFFYMIRKFFAYIQPSFMFYKSLEMTREGTYGIGVAYLFEAVFLFFGTIKLIKERFENKYLIIPWLILGLMPGAITLGEPQPRRTLVIWPMITMISAVGAVSLFSFLYSMKNKVLKFSIVSGLSLLILVNLLQFLLIYSVHFPKQRGDGLMEGSREAAQYILKNQDKYRTIIYDPVRGVEGPFLVNVPHLYILFYSKYDPRQYHSLEKQHGENSFTFDKYTIRVIDWPKDANLKDTLFIGSPWSIPEKNLKKEEILHKIYLSNGKLALLIVSPRNKE